MSVTASYNFLYSPIYRLRLPQLHLPSQKFQIRASSYHMDSHDDDGQGRRRFMEFPHVSSAHRNLMVNLVSTVEDRLGSQLLPCTLPQDVQFYQNQNGSAQATLQIRSGNPSSQVDFTLGSWIHSELPSGGKLNITSFSAYFNSSTDAPNFVMELIQSSPTSLILILDLPPRKDLTLHPEYLKEYYEDTELDTQRQLLEKLPEVTPYVSPSLYIRCLVSPTAILVRVETETGGHERMEEIVCDHVSPVANEMLNIWLNYIDYGGKEMVEKELVVLKKRDELIKSKTIEIDLCSSLPQLFGPETAGRVWHAVQEVFNA